MRHRRVARTQPARRLAPIQPSHVGRHSGYGTGVPIGAYPYEFAGMGVLWVDDIIPGGAGRKAHEGWREWAKVTPFPDTPLDLGPCVATMQAALPADTIICNGAGNYSGWWHRHWRYAGPVCQLAPTAGAMGYGLPAAISAAQVAGPSATVVCFAGDGDFLMPCPELATAGQHGAQPIVLILNNGIYGTIRAHQERNYPGRVSGTDMFSPDFAALARAYGFHGERVETTADFPAAFARALASKTGAVLDLNISPEALTPRQTLSQMRAAALAARDRT